MATPNQSAASQQLAPDFLTPARAKKNCAFIDFAGDEHFPAFQPQASIISVALDLTKQCPRQLAALIHAVLYRLGFSRVDGPQEAYEVEFTP